MMLRWLKTACRQRGNSRWLTRQNEGRCSNIRTLRPIFYWKQIWICKKCKWIEHSIVITSPRTTVRWKNLRFRHSKAFVLPRRMWHFWHSNNVGPFIGFTQFVHAHLMNSFLFLFVSRRSHHVCQGFDFLHACWYFCWEPPQRFGQCIYQWCSNLYRRRSSLPWKPYSWNKPYYWVTSVWLFCCYDWQHDSQ